MKIVFVMWSCIEQEEEATFSPFQKTYGLSPAVVKHELDGRFFLFIEKDVANI